MQSNSIESSFVYEQVNVFDSDYSTSTTDLNLNAETQKLTVTLRYKPIVEKKLKIDPIINEDPTAKLMVTLRCQKQTTTLEKSINHEETTSENDDHKQSLDKLPSIKKRKLEGHKFEQLTDQEGPANQTEAIGQKTLHPQIPQQGTVLFLQRNSTSNNQNSQTLAHKTKTPKRVWSTEDDQNLLDGVEKYNHIWTQVQAGKKHNCEWKRISEEYLGGKFSGAACHNHYFCVLYPGLVKGSWSGEERAQLLNGLEIYGFNWAKISIHIFGRTRSGSSCRGEYKTVLDPNLKFGPLTHEEWEQLSELREKGHIWSHCAHMLNRPENVIQGLYARYKLRNKL